MKRGALAFTFAFTLTLFAGFIPVTSAWAAPAFASEHRCLESATPGKPPIRLEYRTVYDPDFKWSGAYVRYKGQKTPITLVELSRATLAMPEGRPWEFETTYAEVIAGAIKGKYVVTTQGALIEGFTYIAPGTASGAGRKTEFVNVLDVDEDDSCHWH